MVGSCSLCKAFPIKLWLDVAGCDMNPDETLGVDHSSTQDTLPMPLILAWPPTALGIVILL